MIPSKIKIGCITYDVKTTDEILVLDNRVCSGLIHYENALIEISNKRNEQCKEQTFWHELVHGVVKERGLDLGADTELIVDEFAKCLYSIMQDNNFLLPGQKTKE